MPRSLLYSHWKTNGQNHIATNIVVGRRSGATVPSGGGPEETQTASSPVSHLST